MSHNHVTRDIKPIGICPVCDRHHYRQEAIAILEQGFAKNELSESESKSFIAGYIASSELRREQLLAEQEKVRKLKEAAKECLLMVKADYRSLFLEDSETSKKVRQTLKKVEGV